MSCSQSGKKRRVSREPRKGINFHLWAEKGRAHSFDDARADARDEALDGLGAGRGDDEGGAGRVWLEERVALFEAGAQRGEGSLQRVEKPSQLSGLNIRIRSLSSSSGMFSIVPT